MLPKEAQPLFRVSFKIVVIKRGHAFILKMSCVVLTACLWLLVCFYLFFFALLICVGCCFTLCLCYYYVLVLLLRIGAVVTCWYCIFTLVLLLWTGAIVLCCCCYYAWCYFTLVCSTFSVPAMSWSFYKWCFALVPLQLCYFFFDLLLLHKY